MAKKEKGNHRLSRADLDTIIERMTARDIFASAPSGSTDIENVKGSDTAARLFEHTAERLGFGSLALDRVGPADGVYLAKAIGEAINMGSPKADDIEESPTSPDSGG